MIVVELIYNLSVLVALSTLSGFIDLRFNRFELSGKILQGILFGLTAIIGMIYPFVLTEGIIFDGRSIVISICTLVFGPISGGIAAILAIIYRLQLGGGGVLMGNLVIMASFIIGYLFHYSKNNSARNTFSNKELYVFGLLVHAAMLILVLSLPLRSIAETYKVISLTLIGLFPVVTLLVGKILSDQEMNSIFVSQLKESENKYRELFEANRDGITIFYVNRDDNISPIVEANEAAAVMLGLSKNDIIGKYPSEFEMERSEEEIENRKIEIKRNGYTSFESKLKHKDGSWIPVEINVHLLNYKNRPALMNIAKNISERHEAEQAQKIIEENLIRNESLLKEAQRIAHIGSWEWNMISNTVTWSDEMFRIFDVNPNTFTGKPETLLEIIHPDDIDKFKNSMVANAVSGSSPALEYRIIHKDGSVHYIYAEGRIEFNERGKPVRNIGTAQDITERKLLEERLKENEERFRMLFEKAPLGYQSLDENGHFIVVNQAWLDTLGYSYNEVHGKWFGDFLAPKYKEAFRGRFPLFKTAGKIHSEFEMVHKDGTFRYISFEGRIGYKKDGSFQQTHCILSDMTEQRKAKNDLLESEEKHKQMIANISDVIAIMSVDGIVKYKSPNIEKQFGWQAEDLIGTDGWETVHPDDLERIKKEFSICSKKMIYQKRLNTSINAKMVPIKLLN